MRFLFGILAVIVGGYAAVLLWNLISIVGSVWPIMSEGSGGIGAVSSGLIEIVPFAASVVANRLLVRRARRSGSLVRTLHRTHSILVLLVVLLASVVVALLGFASPAPVMWIALGFLTPFLFVAQVILLAALLAALAVQPDPSPAS